MPQDSPSRHLDQFLVRMPEGLRERIADAARLANRSMNAEIVSTLEEAYPREPILDDVIHYARDVAKMYEENPSNGLLRQLRDVLKDLVEYAEHERKQQRGTNDA